MDLKRFKESLENNQAPVSLTPELKALWADANGQWKQAHELVQDRESVEAAWVHAYLHRKEGDIGNALYWYRQANRSRSRKSLELEWEEIVGALLRSS